MSNKIISALESARRYIENVQALGIDLPEPLKKINQAFRLIESEEVTIALLGAFSDGKTTAISGLLKQKLDNMKIDVNESSDEIAVYEVPFLGKNIQFVDTPGLFGEKDKEIEDGNFKRLSDITKDYISQANMVIYVTSAINPIPHDHFAPLRYVMNDLQKLDHAIFVINKMDERFSLLDEQDFAQGVETKTRVVRETLKDCLHLSDEEANNLRIICIAADPKGKGLDYWFAHEEDYNNRSRISSLKQLISEEASKADSKALNLQSALATASDAMTDCSSAISDAIIPINKALIMAQPEVEDLQLQLNHTHDFITSSHSTMKKAIANLEKEIRAAISGATPETIKEIIENQIGVTGNEIDFNIIIRRLDNEVSGFSEKFKESFERSEKIILENTDFIKNQIFNGLYRAKDALAANPNIIEANLVGKVRDLLFKDFKFKPHGKIKLASKLNAGIVAAVNVGFEAYDLFSKYKAQKETDKLKSDIRDCLNQIFKQADEKCATLDSFIKNFAGEFNELKQIVETKEAEIKKLKEDLANLEAQRDLMKNWRKEYAEDIEFS
ncbi:MAG: hypothetical protein HDR86_10070 [Bacteroides sp.]|nr:hypothetical protein [Bacteroides sp.]